MPQPSFLELRALLNRAHAALRAQKACLDRMGSRARPPGEPSHQSAEFTQRTDQAWLAGRRRFRSAFFRLARMAADLEVREQALRASRQALRGPKALPPLADDRERTAYR